MERETSAFLDTIAQALYDRKGMNILALDVASLSTLTEYFVLAEGNVDRHVIALSRSVIDAMREKGLRPLRVEGDTEGDWVVIDFGSIVVHLFQPGMRERFALEELWRDAKVVDVKIEAAGLDINHRVG